MILTFTCWQPQNASANVNLLVVLAVLHYCYPVMRLLFVLYRRRLLHVSTLSRLPIVSFSMFVVFVVICVVVVVLVVVVVVVVVLVVVVAAVVAAVALCSH